ncbi:MAG: hemolysin family protein [Planctomycetota bacterium]
MIIHLLTMAVLLGLSGFFSASETALFSLRRVELRRLERSSGFVNGLILKLRSDTQGLLTTVLFGNMLVNVLYFCLAAAAATSAPTQAAALAVGFGSLASIIICGEVVPKAVAVAIPLWFSTVAAAPLFFFHKTILPVRKALAAVTKLSAVVSGGGEQAAYVTPEELQLLIRATGERGQIAVTERDMMHEIMEFGETRVREVMLPRVDVVAVEADDDAAEIRRLVEKTNVTTMPVYEDNIDNIIGVVSAPDVLLSDSQRISDHVQPVPLFVPETARIETVLHQFRERRCQFGVVVDEYGGFAGILTLEDIVEEIVGDISDEFDVEKAEPVRQLGPDRFVLSGGLSIRDWSELFGLDLDLAEVETLGGFIALRLGRLPSEGESVTLGNLTFTVRKVSRRRVTEVLIERVNGEGEAGK